MSTSLPEINPEENLVTANAETMSPTAAWLTPNDRANIGIAGTTIPNPTATKKDAPTSTLTSRGRSPSGFLNNFYPSDSPAVSSRADA